MSKLYELTDDYRRLLEAAEEGADVGDQLAQLDGELEQKGAGIAKVIASLKADAEAAKEEAERLTARSQSFYGQVERLRTYLRSCMQLGGITRIKGPAFTISLSKAKKKVVVVDESKVPPEHMRSTTTFTPNKVTILQAFEQFGEAVPGTQVEETTTLTIR